MFKPYYTQTRPYCYDVSMKLLLTSGGLRNPTLFKALLELAGRPAGELKVAVIPTAMNVEPGDKTWAIEHLERWQQLGVKQLDIVDISALSKSQWLPRLADSNVIFVGGGNTIHLMTCVNDSGLNQELPGLLKDRIYVGVSAGSYIATPDISFNTHDSGKLVPEALGLVDFCLQVHMNNPKFLFKTLAEIKERVQNCPQTVYGLDDEMAIKIDGDDMTIVGEGQYEKIDNQSA